MLPLVPFPARFRERVGEEVVKIRMHLVAIRAGNLILVVGRPLPGRAGPFDMTLPRRPMHSPRCFDSLAAGKLRINRWRLVGKARDSVSQKNLQPVRLLKLRVLT